MLLLRDALQKTVGFVTWQCRLRFRWIFGKGSGKRHHRTRYYVSMQTGKFSRRGTPCSTGRWCGPSCYWHRKELCMGPHPGERRPVRYGCLLEVEWPAVSI